MYYAAVASLVCHTSLTIGMRSAPLRLRHKSGAGLAKKQTLAKNAPTIFVAASAHQATDHSRARH